MKILVINGPNLNMLGVREPDIYGSGTFTALCRRIAEYGERHGIETEQYQSNHEGDIIDKIQEAYFNKASGVIINPGALSHYSYALRDAISSVDIPFIEVHMSDIKNREDFRKTSVTAPVCDACIFGKGKKGYFEAIDLILNIINK